MTLENAYQEALDHLYSFVDFSLTHQENLSPENFDLERMRSLMVSLGEPQRDYPSLHVAGTKGKGSVCALCAAALQAQGYRVGLYTSPHLKDFEERIQVDGVPIPRAELVALVEAIKPYVAAVPRLTTFEIATALAFWYFSRREVDAAVVEVGLGGRLDATNVITPRVSVITALSLDHTYVLGDTLTEIAAEKAGIVKPGVPLVLAPQAEEARQVVAEIAEQRGSPLVQVGEDYRFAARSRSLDGQAFAVWRQGDGAAPVRLEIPLLGEHQVENAATAYTALQVARREGIEIEAEAMRAGFAGVVWPARFEVLRREPPLVVDSAHNRHSAQALRRTLDEYLPDWPVILVFGVSEDKDAAGMLEALAPRLEAIITSESGHPRAMDAGRLAELARQLERPVKAVPQPAEALAQALKAAGERALVLVAGSIFMAASARIAWHERQTARTSAQAG